MINHIRAFSLALLLPLISSPVFGVEKLGQTTGFSTAHEGVWYDQNRTGVYASVVVTPRQGYDRVNIFLTLDRLPGDSHAFGTTADFISRPNTFLVDETLRSNNNRMGVAATPYSSTRVGTIRLLSYCLKGHPFIDAVVKASGVTQTYQFVPIFLSGNSPCS